MKDVKWKNPHTGEKLIHREKEGKRELIYGIHGSEGERHGHAVWRDGSLEYHRDESGSVTADTALDRRQGMARETSRRKIEQGVDKTRQEFKKFDKEFEKDVKTKKAISEASRASNVGGTDEGMRKMKKRAERAGAAADKKFERDRKGQQKEIDTKAKPREQNLKEMTGKTKQDAQKMERAASRAEVKEAKSELKEAKNEAVEDARFTDKKGAEQKKDRTQAEKNANQKASQMKSAPVRFRR